MIEQQNLMMLEPTPAPGEALPALNRPTIEDVLMLAIERNASIETLEKIEGMMERSHAAAAKREYLAALSRFQETMPVIAKKKEVKNKDKVTTRFTYAPIEDILPIARPHLAREGLSVDTGGHVAKIEGVLCYVGIAHCNHVGGHTEIREFPVPIMPSEYMTDQQSYASASSFAERHAVRKVLGIVTAGLDNENFLQSGEVITPSQAADLQALFEEVIPERERENQMRRFLTLMTRNAKRNIESIDQLPAHMHGFAVETISSKRK